MKHDWLKLNQSWIVTHFEPPGKAVCKGSVQNQQKFFGSFFQERTFFKSAAFLKKAWPAAKQKLSVWIDRMDAFNRNRDAGRSRP